MYAFFYRNENTFLMRRLFLSYFKMLSGREPEENDTPSFLVDEMLEKGRHQYAKMEVI